MSVLESKCIGKVEIHIIPGVCHFVFIHQDRWHNSHVTVILKSGQEPVSLVWQIKCFMLYSFIATILSGNQHESTYGQYELDWVSFFALAAGISEICHSRIGIKSFTHFGTIFLLYSCISSVMWYVFLTFFERGNMYKN